MSFTKLHNSVFFYFIYFILTCAIISGLIFFFIALVFLSVPLVSCNTLLLSHDNLVNEHYLLCLLHFPLYLE